MGTADYRGVTSMQQSRIPRSASWIGAGALVTLLAGAAAALTLHGSTPVTPAAAAPHAHVVAVDLVAPQPIDISFATPVPPKAAPKASPAVAPKAAPAPVAKVRTVRARAAVGPAVAPAVVDSTCSGDGWQQRRGEKALGSLLHPVPTGVTVSFLPGRGDLKGMTYYDTHHVDVFVGTCAAESDTLLRHVVAHEMGHAWDSEHMTDQLRAEYLEARGIEAGTPWFGCNGCRDFATPAGDFAETYAQWQRGTSDSRTQISHPASASELSSLARFFQ